MARPLATPNRPTPDSLTRQTTSPLYINRFGLGLRPVLSPDRAIYWRFFLEKSFPRYMAALLPFIIAMLIWPGSALAISQAPVPMFVLIYLVETRVLSIPNDKARKRLMSADGAAEAYDRLRHRADTALTKLGAKRGYQSGSLALGLEQSRMARVPPLTFLSVQLEGADPPLLALTAEEEAELLAALFNDAFGERDVARLNQFENVFFRSFTLDPAGISAHARMKALAATG